MNSSDAKSDPSGDGDLFSVFVLILSLALSLQAYSEIFQFAGLRLNGVEVEGRWIDNYTEPKTNAPIVVYSFTIEGQTYRNRQVIPSELSTGFDSGDAVMIVYLPDNPELSQLVGTQDINMFFAVQFIVSIIVAIFALQYFIAHKLERDVWALMLMNRIRPQNSSPDLADNIEK